MLVHDNSFQIVLVAVLDQVALYALGYESFIDCELDFQLVRTALIFNVKLPQVPSVPISDKDVEFLLYTR